jgi:hypothetical protein
MRDNGHEAWALQVHRGLHRRAPIAVAHLEQAELEPRVAEPGVSLLEWQIERPVLRRRYTVLAHVLLAGDDPLREKLLLEALSLFVERARESNCASEHARSLVARTKIPEWHACDGSNCRTGSSARAFRSGLDGSNAYRLPNRAGFAGPPPQRARLARPDRSEQALHVDDEGRSKIENAPPRSVTVRAAPSTV